MSKSDFIVMIITILLTSIVANYLSEIIFHDGNLTVKIISQVSILIIVFVCGLIFFRHNNRQPPHE